MLRAENELVDALMDDLGFNRRAKRIDERLRSAARDASGSGSS